MARGRPALKAGEHGEVTVRTVEGGYEARCRARGMDGMVRIVSRRAPRKADAKRRLLESLGEVAEQRPAWTVAHYVDAWLESCRRRGLAARTLDTYRLAGARIVGDLGGVFPADLTAAMIQDQVNSLGPGAGALAVKAWRGVVAQAAKDSALDRDPMLGVCVEAPVKRSKPKALEPEDVPRLRAHLAAYDPKFHAPSPDFMRIFDWIAETGCRTSEALGVHGEHVRRQDVPTGDGGTRRVWVWHVAGTVIEAKGAGVFFQDHTKTHDDRHLAIPDHLADGLPLYGLAFPSSVGKLRSLSAFNRSWRKRVAGSEWEGVTPKILRATVATRLARLVGVDAAQAMLGHEPGSKVTRRHYVMPTPALVDYRSELARVQVAD